MISPLILIGGLGSVSRLILMGGLGSVTLLILISGLGSVSLMTAAVESPIVKRAAKVIEIFILTLFNSLIGQQRCNGTGLLDCWY